MAAGPMAVVTVASDSQMPVVSHLITVIGSLGFLGVPRFSQLCPPCKWIDAALTFQLSGTKLVPQRRREVPAFYVSPFGTMRSVVQIHSPRPELYT